MSETEAQTTKKRTKKDDYIVQGSILAAAAVLTKIIGVVYRIPLTNILGDEGNGFYGYAYQVYAIALMPSDCRIQAGIDPTCKASETKCIPCIYLFTCFCNRCWIIHLADNLFGSRTDFNTFNEIST